MTVLVIDLCSGFGSLLHVLFALGCRCLAVCVEHNKKFVEGAQASFPQSVNQEFVDKLDPQAFVGVLSRRSFNLVLVRRGSSCQSDTVRSTDVTDLAVLSNQLDFLLNLVSGSKVY